MLYYKIEIFKCSNKFIKYFSIIEMLSISYPISSLFIYTFLISLTSSQVISDLKKILQSY